MVCNPSLAMLTEHLQYHGTIRLHGRKIQANVGRGVVMACLSGLVLEIHELSDWNRCGAELIDY